MADFGHLFVLMGGGGGWGNGQVEEESPTGGHMPPLVPPQGIKGNLAFDWDTKAHPSHLPHLPLFFMIQ